MSTRYFAVEYRENNREVGGRSWILPLPGKNDVPDADEMGINKIKTWLTESTSSGLIYTTSG